MKLWGRYRSGLARRNQLHKGDTALVDVEEELSSLLSYVHLQQERLNDKYTISCWGLADVKGFGISPFLLVPLVENCFKHVSSDPGRGNYICIECRAKGHSFFFRTGNTCIATATERPGEKAGSGLEIVKKRLDLLYPGRHELFMKQRPGYYQTTLTLEC
jgi:two-component system LytT family sensor kinase